MPIPNLSDFTDRLNGTVDTYLGENITYQTEHSAAHPVMAHINYGDEPEDFGAGHVVDRKIMVKITKSLLSAKPSDGDRITGLIRAPGLTFKPSGEPHSRKTGTRWEFYLKEVR